MESMKGDRDRTDDRVTPRAERYIRDYLSFEQRRLELAIDRMDRYISAYANGLFQHLRNPGHLRKTEVDPGRKHDYVPDFAVPLSRGRTTRD